MPLLVIVAYLVLRSAHRAEVTWMARRRLRTWVSKILTWSMRIFFAVILVRGDVYYWGSLMAACLITSIPIGILYNMFLGEFIEGFTVGRGKVMVM